MRKILTLNSGWQFAKTTYQNHNNPEIFWQNISLPHTFNAIDGADGKGEYYRGEVLYKKTISPKNIYADYPITSHVVLRILALSLEGSVYANGEKITSHKGGYSAFTADITAAFFTALQNDRELELCITADNSNHSDVYPQTADFTFYGGLYRGAELLLLPKEHFQVSYHAAKGLAITTEILSSGAALLHLNSFVTTKEDAFTIRYQIVDREGVICAETFRQASAPKVDVLLPAPHLWQGVEDPYLYRLTATLIYRNEQVDQISTTFGIREFRVDSEKGFFLNDKPMMLRGVSRHQDWLYEGYALSREQHFRDAELIKEIGANTVRLAHYQHSEDFYDACDEMGFIVWAEIPYISIQSDAPAAHENAKEQMLDLIYQNYNHPSICFWGISNEITIGGEKDHLVENHEELHQLVKERDPGRLTTMAHVSMLSTDSKLHGITDIEAYNHYFGWYGGSYEQNETWLDKFHEKYPDICLGLSEYGAEGIITYQSESPKCRDYSESYQALYHEHMAQILMERPYLWGTYVWNMFDFGCAARDEGGVAGRNNKGLVTMDRQIKKDAFFVYKAYWSKEPFVYIAGRRNALRDTERTSVKIYSNQPYVNLYVNGDFFATCTGNHIFQFENVLLSEGFNYLTATAGACNDTITLEKVSKRPAVYTLPETDDNADGVSNWFEKIETVASDAPMEFSTAHFSVHDKLKDLFENEEAFAILSESLSSMSGMKLKKSMLSMMQDLTLIELSGMFTASSDSRIPSNALQIINSELNKIKKHN